HSADTFAGSARYDSYSSSMNGALLPKRVLVDSNSLMDPIVHLSHVWFGPRRPNRSERGGAAAPTVSYRSESGLTVLGLEPVKSCRGRPILYSGSDTISFSCAIQPTVRASAKIAVKSCTGIPIAFCTIPE